MASERKEGGDRISALVYENVRDIIFLLGVEGERFRFLEINPAFTSATGLTEAQVVGKAVDEIIPEPSLSLVLESYRTAIRERRTVRWEEVTVYPAGKKYGQVSVIPIVDATGACTSLVGTVHDITPEARARRLTEAEQRVLELVASNATLAETLSTLVLAIEDQIPMAIGSVVLVSPDGLRIVHGAAPHLPDEYNVAIDGAPIGPSEGSCGTAAALRKPVIVTDIDVDPRWEKYRHHAQRHGLRACWSTPIMSRDGRVLGTFALYYREPRAPTQEDLDLIARAVHVAGIAIQRFELDDQLRALSTRLETALEEQRAGIAREIHDQLGQSLTVLKMDLAFIARRAISAEGISTDDLVGKIKELSNLTDEIIGQVRRISAELRPAVLDDLGLAAALGWLAQEFERRTDILASVDVKLQDDRLPRDLSTGVFRAAQEALTNVARHAEADCVDITLEAEAGYLVLKVTDNGKGIRPEHINDPRSLGLLGMRERARRLGGSVTFTNAADGGTSVIFRLPFNTSQAAVDSRR